MTAGDRAFTGVVYALLFVVLVMIAFPLWYVLVASISAPAEVMHGNVCIWPKGSNLDAYRKVFTYQKVLTGYRNTIVYTVLGTLINLVMTTATAYPLSRQDFTGRVVIGRLLTFTMFFSGGMIPLYLVVRGLGLYDTMWAILLPASISMFNCIIMRSYFETSIPKELQEAGIIDGCGNIAVLFRIVLPLSMPILAVMVIYYGVQHWNAYFSALIYLSDAKKYPLQLILREILVQFQMQDIMGGDAAAAADQQVMMAEGIKYALIVVSSVPIMMIYPFVQKYFAKGVMVGAVKG